jgi:hypothetical protein
MPEFFIWVYNTAVRETVRIGPAGKDIKRARKLAREVKQEYSQIACHDVHLLREVKY